MNLSRNPLTETITTKQGDIIGEISTTFNGHKYKSFSGIPYAAPPTGNLRFRPPLPYPRFRNTFYANKKGMKCPQRNILGRIVGNEDCLYLNIYVPLDNEILENAYPVMVFIHGGGFTNGDSGTNIYGPDYFVSSGVILVTLNYRLGVLGFLTLGDDYAPGNLAFRDQQLALQWIKNNIDAFSGDPHNITLFGESVGSISCLTQVVSPRCVGKEFFHKVIAQSGSFWDFYQLSTFKPDNGQRLAQQLGFSVENKSKAEILHFLQQVKLSRLVKESLTFDTDDSIHTFVPIVDYFCKDPVLPQNGFDIIMSGNFNHIPMMHGVCQDDGMVFSLVCDKVSGAWQRMEDDWENIGCKKLFNLPLSTQNNDLMKLIREVKQFYYGDENRFSSENFNIYTKLGGDRVFHSHCHMTCLLMSQFSSQPVYRYVFKYEGKNSLVRCSKMKTAKVIVKLGVKKLTGLNIFTKRRHGVCHADDIIYLFKNKMGLNSDESETDTKMREQMVSMWTNFAKYGSPLNHEKWKPYSHENPYHHFEISTNSSMREFEEEYKDRVDFWTKRVIPQLIGK